MLIHRIENQSKTLTIIVFRLIAPLFSLLSHINTTLASPESLTEVEVPLKQPLASASAVFPILQTGPYLRKDGHFLLTRIRALDGQKDGKNPSFCIKKARKFNSQHFNVKSTKISTIFGGNLD